MFVSYVKDTLYVYLNIVSQCFKKMPSIIHVGELWMNFELVLEKISTVNSGCAGYFDPVPNYIFM